jgi:ATP-binding cassette subfamily B protein
MNKIMLRSLLAICKRYWMALTAFLVGGILQVLVGLSAVSYFQRVLDGIASAGGFSELAGVLLRFAGLTLVNHTLIYLGGYPQSILHNGAYLWAKLQAMKKVSGIDFLSYQDLGTGQLVQVIENGATATKNIFGGFYLNTLRAFIPQFVIALAFVRYYDRTLFAIVLGAYAFLFLLSNRLMVALRREVDRMLAKQESFAKFSVRGFMELVVFRVNSRFGKELERVQGISDEIVRSRAKIYLVQELFFTGFAVLVFLLEIGVIVQQAHEIIAGISTIGTLVALVMYIREVCSPISHFSIAYVSYRVEMVAFTRFGEFLALPKDAGLGTGRDIDIDAGEVVFEDVDFCYGDRSVLQGLSLTFEGGKTTALVGRSGAGKSTLVRLLLHLLKPDSGRVLVDGQDLSDVNLESFYRHVTYIPQEPPVFDGTIGENLVFDERVDEAKIAEAIGKTGLDELMGRLPDGLETVVGERGVKLSGGERQRLAFARVLIQDPRIVVLDEPTAALDSVTESFVTERLAGFFRGRTVIVIAHRLQTVKGADKIVVLEDGAIIQEGGFDALVAASGRFRQLWEEQTAGRLGEAGV